MKNFFSLQRYSLAVATLMIFLGIFGCSNDPNNLSNKSSKDEKPISESTRPAQPESIQNQDTIGKTAIIAVVGPHSHLRSQDINTWDALTKTKGQVHLFADPQQQKRLDAFTGHKHLVDAAHLTERLQTVLANVKADRLIFFIDTYCGSPGEKSPGWCYGETGRGETKPDLDENFLLEVLKPMAAIKVPKQSLLQALLVPMSYESQIPIMEKFSEKAKAIDWPFSLSVVASSLAGGGRELRDNLISSTKLSPEQIRHVLTATKLEDLLKNIKKYIYQLWHIKKPGSELALADFGFNIGIEHELVNQNNLLAFPYKKSVKQVVENLLPAEFFPNIAELVFEYDPPAGGELIRTYVPVNGNLDLVLDKEEYKNMKYSRLNVILRRVKGK